MSRTRTQARDEINSLIKVAADTIDELTVIWEDTKLDLPEGSDPPLPYIKVFIRHQNAGQGSLSGTSGNRMFDRRGQVVIQLYTPVGDGLTDSDIFATTLKNAMEGQSTANGVWFRDVNAREVGKDGPKFLTNITAEFEYVEVR